MRVQDLKNYMEIHVPYKYVLNEFHEETPDNCCVVILGSAGRSTRTVGALQFQFIVRNADPELAEDIAFKIHKHFNNKSDYEVGDTTIVLSKGQQSVPLYTGKDTSDRFIYSVNIETIVDNQ